MSDVAMNTWIPGFFALSTALSARTREQDIDRALKAVDVLLACPGERQNDRLRDDGGDATDGLVVALAGGGEAGLDHVDAEVLELARDRQLLLHVHGGTGRLLAVAEGGVEDLYAVHGVRPFRHRRGPYRIMAQKTRKPRWVSPPVARR